MAVPNNTLVQVLVSDGITNPPSAYADAYYLGIYDTNNSLRDYDSNLIISYTPGVLQSNYKFNNL